MKTELTKQAAKYYEKAPANLQKMFDNALENLLTGGGDIKPLVGYPGFFRLRIGSYRMVFTIDANADTVVIIKIGPRGDVYKK